MAIICITLVLAIFMFIAAPILTGWSSGYLDIRSMYDVQVYSMYNDVYEEKIFHRIVMKSLLIFWQNIK